MPNRRKSSSDSTRLANIGEDPSKKGEPDVTIEEYENEGSDNELDLTKRDSNLSSENNPRMKRRLSQRPSERRQSETGFSKFREQLSNPPEAVTRDKRLSHSEHMFVEEEDETDIKSLTSSIYRRESIAGAEKSNRDAASSIGDAISKFVTHAESMIEGTSGDVLGSSAKTTGIEALGPEHTVGSDVHGKPRYQIAPMTFTNPSKNLWRVVTCCLWAFTGGFSDGAPGALLPYIEEYYGISYSIVSLIWMSNAVGFILVALFSNKIQEWFVMERAVVIGSMISSLMYIFVSTGSKFPVIVTGFFFGGVGLAICLSQMNIFLSRLDRASLVLGYYHGAYGLGASISPLIATQFINRGVKWHYFYLILVGLMLFNAVNCYLAFKGASEDLAPWDNADEKPPVTSDDEEAPINYEETSIGLQDLDRNGNPISEGKHTSNKDSNNMSLALGNRLTWLMSFFVLFYQGSEVSMGGWIVTYLLDYRKGNPKSVGYVASGFWFGLTLGRLALTRPFHKYLGARRGIIIMAVLSIVSVILTWVVPSVIAAGVFVSIAGVFIGPTYPLMITLASRMFPRKIQVVSLTIMTAFGSSGGALFPFIVGLISQFSGAFVVLPIFIALYTSMLIIWIMLPNVEGRERHSGKMTLWQRLW